ncbi:MAG: adenine phosphoribosyltransferase [Chloroflexi bacterium]|nr:adenine phosphoribosyltransferase [Chloroflexota bacterium]
MSLDLTQFVRNIPDFPIPGVQFKDITPLLGNAQAFDAAIEQFAQRYANQQLQAIVGIESRGFIFGAPLALRLGIGFVPIRKPGKLPAQTIGVDYSLEYGTNRLEIHNDALQAGDRVVVVDDLLATGGTVVAACDLLNQLGAEVVEAAFLIELTFLGGREKLGDRPFYAQIQY